MFMCTYGIYACAHTGVCVGATCSSIAHMPMCICVKLDLCACVYAYVVCVVHVLVCVLSLCTDVYMCGSVYVSM